MIEPAYEHNGRHVSRERFYAIACDPARSVAVEACAGAGKTWMLVSRILRALLAGARPHEILAITFTKKAAGEMRQRLHEWLAEWSAVAPEKLATELRMRGIAAPTPDLVHTLKELYAALLGAGRPVQIRTFHSWFASLLSSAPLAVLEYLGLPSHYELLEDDYQAVSRVWRRFYVAVARNPAARADYEASVAAYGRSQTQKALEGALSKRVEFALADANGVIDASVKPLAAQFPDFDGCDDPLAMLQRHDARETLVAAARALGAASAATHSAKGGELEAALSAHDFEGVMQALFTTAGEPRKFSDKIAGIDGVRAAQALVQRIAAARGQHEAWLHQQRMLRLARLLLAEFAALKREQGWIDMNDVERAALVLLSDEVLSGWIQERLDVQVKQLLIDEFQDTNPLQWQALHAWLSGYAGAGAGGPSVFLVGDPKQSIYRFRRAEPQVFLAAQRFVVEGLGGDRLSCDHTHRNAPQVLAVVNQAMEAAQQAGDYQGFRAHTTQSSLQGSAWALPQVPREAKAAAVQSAQWRDSLTVARDQPEEKLIVLECRQAAAWIAGEIRRGIQPEDLMVLARKRDRLAAMEAELRALHVPTQQPEQTDLSEAPEVRDLVALLDVLVSPAHDLSMAQVLKSPLFALDDEALVHLAVRARAERAEGRATSWFELLRQPETLTAPLQAVGTVLQRWKGLVDRWPPHDALQAIYEDGDVLARYARAVPSTMRRHVLANLRALLEAALAVRGGRALTPYAFVRALKAGGVPGPAVAQAGVVRLLTVHGAKGLEADTVLLLDTDGAAARAETMGVICDWPGEQAAPVRFSFLTSESRPPACNVEALAAERVARQREELNALYVALTRARRRLVLSSVAPAGSGGNGASWWQRVSPLCEPLATEAPAQDAVLENGAEADFLLATVPVPPRQHSLLSGLDRFEPDSPAARFGRAMHWLLEHGAQDAATPALLRRATRDFGLDASALRDASAMARRIAQGEGAWAWDAGVIDWQGNEVELLHQGERLRLDRLVRRRDNGEWWVLDYKSLAEPGRQQELIAQMRRYREAVLQAYPGATVRAAFLTGQGRLVTLD
jgi:ATP-dependent helicase/nuclease subunit A